MKKRMLVAGQSYFGLDALVFRRGAARTLARLAGRAPSDTSITAESVREDFRLDAVANSALLDALVTARLLQRDASRPAYRVTERFREFALAPMVRPLTRAEAQEMVAKAGAIATEVNARWTHNPLAIAMLAVSGGYVDHADVLRELALWVLVRPRSHLRMRASVYSTSRSDGAREIVSALRTLSPLVAPRVVNDAMSLQRPFRVVFRGDDVAAPLPTFLALRHWGDSVRRRFGRR